MLVTITDPEGVKREYLTDDQKAGLDVLEVLHYPPEPAGCSIQYPAVICEHGYSVVWGF